MILKQSTIFKDIVADSTIAEDREDVSFIWDNYYDEEQNINELALSLFIREKDNLYRKSQEFHYQIGLTCEDMKACIEASGMELVAMFDAFTEQPATADSERVYVIAREKKACREAIFVNMLENYIYNITCRKDMYIILIDNCETRYSFL